MDFASALSAFIGSSVEVFMDDTFDQGTLLDVNDGYLTLQVTDPVYHTPIGTKFIFMTTLNYVRVIV